MTYKLATALLALEFISCQFQLQGDNCDMTKSSSNVNAISIQSWDKNAKMWNELMGEGSSFQLDVVDPVLERMLPNITSQMKVIEIGCGNGFLARRFAKQGATIFFPTKLRKTLPLTHTFNCMTNKASCFFWQIIQWIKL